MFFGMNEPTTTKSTFYATLRDSLKLNLYQVATNGGAYLRHDFFLNNGIPNDLKVLVLEDSLAGFSSVTGLQKDILLGGGYDAVIHRNVDSMLVHGGLSILRFYLRDEPTIDMNLAWNYVQGRIRVFSSGLGSLAAFADTGIHINHFVNGAQPSELIIDFCTIACLYRVFREMCSLPITQALRLGTMACILDCCNSSSTRPFGREYGQPRKMQSWRVFH